jgi:glycosyltransferase involved in cell wall biosynthesis
MKPKVAFLTTIFPMERKYIFDFFESLSRQTYTYFDVIVVNDGYEGLSEIIKKYQNLRIVEIRCQQSPSKNREFGIRFTQSNGYDIVIFGDSDDFFSENRVEYSVNLLKNYDIVVNDLTLIEDSQVVQEKYISQRINSGSAISSTFIEDKNIFGFTNTSINLNKLGTINFDDELIAVDWYFFTVLLLNNATAVFTNEVISYYRQHENSLIGLGKVMTLEYFKKGIEVKLKHYENFPVLCDRYDEIKEISELDFEEWLMIVSNSNPSFPLWWEEVGIF